MDHSLKQMCLEEIDKKYNECIAEKKYNRSDLQGKIFNKYHEDYCISSKEEEEKYEKEKNEITIGYKQGCLECIDQMTGRIRDLNSNFRENELEFLTKIRSEEFIQ